MAEYSIPIAVTGARFPADAHVDACTPASRAASQTKGRQRRCTCLELSPKHKQGRLVCCHYMCIYCSLVLCVRVSKCTPSRARGSRDHRHPAPSNTRSASTASGFARVSFGRGRSAQQNGRLAVDSCGSIFELVWRAAGWQICFSPDSFGRGL